MRESAGRHTSIMSKLKPEAKDVIPVDTNNDDWLIDETEENEGQGFIIPCPGGTPDPELAD